MSKGQLTFGIIALVILIAVITNPDLKRHSEVVGRSINDIHIETLQKNGNFSDLDLHEVRMQQKIYNSGAIYAQYLFYNNYILFSTSKIDTGMQKGSASFGLFGNVFPSSDLNDIFGKMYEQLLNQRNNAALSPVVSPSSFPLN